VVLAWDLVKRKGLFRHPSRGRSPALAAEGKLVVETTGNALILLETASGNLRHTLTVPETRREEILYEYPAVSPDGRLIAAVIGFAPPWKRGGGKTARVWELASGREAICLQTGVVQAWPFRLTAGCSPRRQGCRTCMVE
jgi:hypothetical protein